MECKGGPKQNDVIGTLDLLKMKNGWNNPPLLSNFLSFRTYCMFIAALVRFLWPYLLEEKIIIFQFFKKMQRGQKVNILDKKSKNYEIWKLPT